MEVKKRRGKERIGGEKRGRGGKEERRGGDVEIKR